MSTTEIVPASAAVVAFLALVEEVAASTGRSEARLSTVVFGSGDQILRLRGGADITTGRLARAIVALTTLQVTMPRRSGRAEPGERP